MSNEQAVAGDPENVPYLKQKKSCSKEQLLYYHYMNEKSMLEYLNMTLNV